MNTVRWTPLTISLIEGFVCHGELETFFYVRHYVIFFMRLMDNDDENDRDVWSNCHFGNGCHFSQAYNQEIIQSIESFNSMSLKKRTFFHLQIPIMNLKYSFHPKNEAQWELTWHVPFNFRKANNKNTHWFFFSISATAKMTLKMHFKCYTFWLKHIITDCKWHERNQSVCVWPFYTE